MLYILNIRKCTFAWMYLCVDVCIYYIHIYMYIQSSVNVYYMYIHIYRIPCAEDLYTCLLAFSKQAVGLFWTLVLDSQCNLVAASMSRELIFFFHFACLRNLVNDLSFIGTVFGDVFYVSVLF